MRTMLPVVSTIDSVGNATDVASGGGSSFGHVFQRVCWCYIIVAGRGDACDLLERIRISIPAIVELL